MSMVLDRVLITSNPATGAEVGRVKSTDPDGLRGIVDRARSVQSEWGKRSWRERQAFLIRWWKILSRDAGVWADLIRDETGKPRAEALAGDVISTLDGIRWTVKHGGRALKEEKIGPGWQRWLMMPTGRLAWNPLGVVGMIGTWNYPLYLNAPSIAHALAAGNSVVWKPSELAVRTGQKIQQSLEEAGAPEGLVTAVYGGGEVGRALVEADPDKVVFTGGVENGRHVLAALGERGIPAVAELSGFDPAIILPDAPRRSTVKALAWAAFVGCGQTCVSVKRVYVVGDAAPWAEAFASLARDLKVGDPAQSDTDIGPMITSAARDRFDRTIKETVRAGARVRAGGTNLAGPGWFYAPTVLEADTPEPETSLAGAFGPVILVRGVPDAGAAVEVANSGGYGLGASVWGRSRGRARTLARRLHAGVVSVNEAVTPTAHAAAPFGGCKASGYGRTHGTLGLREFTCPQILFGRRPGGFRPQLFPYSRSGTMERFLAFYTRMFHPRA
jgi:acyl-CoA reductase-like NAD-dependent aldehyde dehydrogenase